MHPAGQFANEADNARYRDLLGKERSKGGKRLAVAAAVLVFYAFCIAVSNVEPARLIDGIPRLFGWLARSWPPDLTDFDAVLRAAAETVAIATLGTTLGAIIAIPLTILASANVTPSRTLYWPARSILNVLRSIDTFVFALLFVAAVGLLFQLGILGLTRQYGVGQLPQ